MSRVKVPTWACMNSDTRSFFGREVRQCKIVQINKGMKEIPRRINFDGKPTFGEVDLDGVRALAQAITDFVFMLAQKILDKLFTWVACNFLCWIHKTQGGAGNDRL